jgi:dTDP-glucose 4,6-dehydratase
MKLLVTGGAGFIGSAVCRRLGAGNDISVVVVDKLTYAGHRSSLAPVEGRIAFEQADIADAAAMQALFTRHAPDAVMHLAAESHVDRSITGAGDFVETNIVGTFVLLQAACAYWEKLAGAARERFRFHHVSTDEVYGSLGPQGHFSETSRYDPRSPYSASKAAADHLVSAWHHTYGLPTLVSNCCNNYGPYQLPEKLIPLTILNGMEGKPLPVYGDGANVRDWLFVEDHVDALLAVLTRGRSGQAYAVGARTEQRNIDVVRGICRLLDRHATGRSHETLVTHVKDRPGHDRRYAIDPTRLETELAWKARTGFAEGLERTVLWYLENRAWWEPLRRMGHGTARLGLLEASPSDWPGRAKG